MRQKTPPPPGRNFEKFVKFLKPALIIVLVLAAVFVVAQQVPVPSINLGIDGKGDKEQMSASLKILALLTVLSLAPAILILTTAFTRIVIVLSFVRTALGTQNIPPNQVLIGLSLFLSFFVMGPTYQKINDQAIQPYMAAENPISFDEAVDRAQKPLRDFMLKNTYEKDLKMFLDMRHQNVNTREEVPIMTLIPAFVISELKTSFVIGFYIFLPFVVIDLIVASLLMGMGMMMMPPVVVSLPAKILVFVLADGWSILVRALLSGYGT
ncbi:MAG TPA: flagellar type III secretion system pore protein FliP [Fimbriimonadaceae bacterium]|nr:flagellar type III secretion system pore protein FliP [Fimbriimonadaceae bacterium]